MRGVLFSPIVLTDVVVCVVGGCGVVACVDSCPSRQEANYGVGTVVPKAD